LPVAIERTNTSPVLMPNRDRSGLRPLATSFAE
jgi:hypothetical protein